MSAALRALPSSARCTGSAARKPAASIQLLKQLVKLNPNQLSSYHGVRLMLPAKGRPTLVPQGSAAVRKPVQMSFLGVGAPEAILVAVVALVVFGPKGLADAARSVGSSLRAFQPTIKEVVQVSQELKGSLEKELGLDELREAARPTMRSLSELETSQGLTPIRSDLMAKSIDADIEAKRAASAEMAWGGSASSSAAEASASAEALAASAVAATKPAGAAPLKDIATMSVEELEAELSRRRTVADKKQ
ncbi:Sec-independent protein translocase protein TATB, chloroplastic [Tetrabaena socialis]|uniref:Sec-independent protein translocase protein TATB, chloroplastic n=1 Tax=Tetrabaena socialis TaxID=47790 RepID=A0A2J8A4S8_9CHLO|nr:Sec-independent protein translocase protein TATB, chloroplastic [Tetrabaena socialis]|eukprot:PNH07532.1 Sec-independent protein translocase protein TATB, chloroplastic [Tetrabaena socialis]